jgi:sigma-E factor negative regulatory protein RseA
MTEQIREQVSALLDGELPRDEMGLLLRRLDRDAELRRAFGSYALIGETLRAPGGHVASPTFARRVGAALDGDDAVTRAPRRTAEAGVTLSPAVQFWRRPAVRTALAASAAAAAVVLFRPEAQQQSQPAAMVASAVPQLQAMVASPTPAQSQRMASYVMAHSQFSTPMVRRNVLTSLLAADPGISRVSYTELGEAR